MENIFEIINHWKKKILAKAFKYNNGFFEFPYQFTHPKLMVESVKALPFMYHYPDEQVLKTNTLFLKGALYYFEIEEGLWVMISDCYYKTNLAFINKDQIVTKSFYNLSYISYSENSERKGNLNGHTIIDNIWTLYHPGEELNAYQYKDTSNLVICFSFGEDWLERNFSISKLDNNHPLKVLFDSELKYNPFIRNPVVDARFKLEQLFLGIKSINQGESAKFLFKSKALSLIGEFFEGITRDLTDINFSVEDKRIMIKIIDYLENNLLKDFPGINFLANYTNTSPTKVKTLFKQWFRISTLKWFRAKQMDLAMKLLKEDKIKVKDLAFTMGYTNASKFTLAFKNYHHTNPSNV